MKIYKYFSFKLFPYVSIIMRVLASWFNTFSPTVQFLSQKSNHMWFWLNVYKHEIRKTIPLVLDFGLVLFCPASKLSGRYFDDKMCLHWRSRIICEATHTVWQSFMHVSLNIEMMASTAPPNAPFNIWHARLKDKDLEGISALIQITWKPCYHASVFCMGIIALHIQKTSWQSTANHIFSDVLMSSAREYV